MAKAIVHASPLPGRAITPCCGKIPFELPQLERITNDVAEVTCGVIEYATGRRDFTYYLHEKDGWWFSLAEAFKREGFQVDKATEDKISELGNPFYEVALRCWLNVETGMIGIEKVLP